MPHQIVDAHCDTVYMMATKLKDYNFARRNREAHLDLPRMKESGVKLQFFACYIDMEQQSVSPLCWCLKLIDLYYREVQQHCNDLQTIYSTADLEEVISSSKIGALLSVEGGEALEGELAIVRMLMMLGIRSIGLTWNHQNQLASGVGKAAGDSGLTKFGRQVIREMNTLGMLVDLAHINEQGFYEAISASSAPLVVSHANARALCDHPRNLSDEQLKKIKEINGVIGLSFCPQFIDSEKASLKKLLDHFVHIAEIIGTDHLGIGSDFDGITSVPEGLEDATRLPNLIDGLAKRGFSSRDIKKIATQNFIRVLKQVLPPVTKKYS